MRLKDCHSFGDFRELARRRLPSPIFNYIDGAADDESTYDRNTKSFEDCDLVPNVLRGVENIDMSVEILGQKLEMPIYCSPTALQRVFHHEGENAVAAAADKYGTLFGVSSLGTVSLSEVRQQYSGPQCYQFYFHKDRELNQVMLENAKNANVDVMMLTVDTITGGNRERDLKTGFSIPFKLSLSGITQFAIKPMWALNYLTHKKFSLPQLDDHVDMSDGPISIGRYFTEMLDPCLNWDDVAKMVEYWDGQFCLKGVMSVEDAKKAVDVGASAIMPLASPIGSGLGIQNKLNVSLIIKNSKLPIIIDAGIGTASDATIAMEMGCAAVLINSAIAQSQNPILMAKAFKDAVISGRNSFLAGRMEKNYFGSPSSPTKGLI